MNARFWVYWNAGWVKLTLPPGRELSATRFQYTQEGWSRESATWTHDGDGVSWEWLDEGRDCDGRMERAGEMCCELGNLRARDANLVDPCGENSGILCPEWTRVDSSQRDYAAEAAGY